MVDFYWFQGLFTIFSCHADHTELPGFTASKPCFTHFNYTAVITTCTKNKHYLDTFQALTLSFHMSSLNPKDTRYSVFAQNKNTFSLTRSLKYVHSLLVRMGYFIWEKWLEDGWIFYMMAKPGVFLPKENYLLVFFP